MTFFAVTLLFGDEFYGLTGMFIWYAAGLAVRRDELAAAPAEGAA
jgi:hypothetical protein